MQAKAQNMKNSTEYFKIDPAKKKMAVVCGFNLAAMAVNEGIRVTKRQFLT